MYKLHTLKNGIRVITVPFADARSVSTLIFFGIGSRYEDSSISGISHLIEHMLFKGTKKRPTSKEISETIDALGGDINAATSKNYTVYLTKVPSNHFSTSLDVLSDMIQHSVLDSKELAKEKNVVVEEINMYYDMPSRHVVQLYEELLWGNTPLGWDIAGTATSVTNMKRKDLVDYIKRGYTKSNMIVAVGGAFDEAKILKSIEQSFHNIPQGNVPTFVRNTKKQTTPKTTFESRPIQQTNLCLGVRVFPYDHPDRYVLLLLNTLLGGTMSSRLFIRIREEMGLAYAISTQVVQYADTGTFMVHAGVEAKKTKAAIKAILHELNRMKKSLITSNELTLIKEHFKGKLLLSLDDHESLADWFARQLLLRGTITPVEEIIAGIDAVTRDDIRRVAQTIFVDSSINISVIGPFEKESAFLPSKLSFA